MLPVAPRRFDLRAVTIALLMARLIIVVATMIGAATATPTEDVLRFHEVAASPGVPYRDFPVEYAPAETAIVRVIASGDLASATTRLALLAFIADIAAWIAVGFGWGWATAERYLWIGTPLLVFLYERFDLVAVALATWGACLAVRGWQRSGGLSMAAAILSKLWPAVLLPGFLVTGRKRAFAWSLGAMTVSFLIWVAVGGIGGVSDVLTFRHASGWEVEGTVGTVVWILTGGPIRTEAGAPRIGSVPSFAPGALAFALAAVLTAVWLVARSRARGGFGAAAVAAVAALIAMSPTFSLQYAAWLLPWGAIAWNEGDRWHFLGVAAVSVLTGVLFVAYAPDRAALSQALLICRNVLVASLPILWIAWDARPQDVDRSAANDTGSVTGSVQTNRSQT
jgi:hypothetical protein